MASSALGLVDINGIVHRLSDVSSTSQPAGAQVTVAAVDTGNVQTLCAKAKPQAEPQKLTRAGKPWDMKAALKAIGEKHGETLRALAK